MGKDYAPDFLKSMEIMRKIIDGTALVRPKPSMNRTQHITGDDIINLRIELETMSVDEFING